jgi:hypothetical protein
LPGGPAPSPRARLSRPRSSQTVRNTPTTRPSRWTSRVRIGL